MVINYKESTLSPSQKITHLGFDINLADGRLTLPPGKLQAIRRELGKLVTHNAVSSRKMAAILGAVRSFLTAIPPLRVFSDEMANFIAKHSPAGWDVPHLVPTDLQNQVRQLKQFLQDWPGRPFEQTPHRKLHSDA